MPLATPRMIGRATLVLLAAALLLGASNVTGKPITDIRMIEGRWRGQIKLAGGPYEIYYLTVESRRHDRASGARRRAGSKVTLSGGKARFALPHLEWRPLLLRRGPGARHHAQSRTSEAGTRR